MKKIKNNYDLIINTLTCILGFVSSILSNAFYEEYIKSNMLKSELKIFIIIMFFILLFIVVFIIFKLSKFIKNILFFAEHQQDCIKNAFLVMKDYNKKQITMKQHNMSNDKKDRINEHYENINNIIEHCYMFFRNTFLKNDLVNAIDFEVTFMTKSYKDNEITIPSFYSRDGRIPKSMTLREKNINIYENTETAKLYKDTINDRILIKIIESTLKEDYKELYGNQKNRIKSSIIIPLYGCNFSLLGTLVVHCDVEKFFKKKDKKFWFELLDIFATELSKEKVILDNLVKNNVSNEQFPF